MATYTVEELRLNDILDLRTKVLRKGTPSSNPSYAEDNDPSTVHLGVRDSGSVIAVSSWIDRPFPLDTAAVAVQLKGMAVDDALQGTGIGRLIIDAGEVHARKRRASIVWARARDAALDFYTKCGYVVVGEMFMDEATGLPHHIVVKRLTPDS
jgi:GNAT superfamily N-acetyltransferase